jgi:hypothetical protein
VGDIDSNPVQKSADGAALNISTSRSRSAWTYVALTFALSIPFWIPGALTNTQLLPGIPTSAFGIICPVAVVVVIMWGPRTLVRAHGVRGSAARAAVSIAEEAQR